MRCDQPAALAHLLAQVVLVAEAVLPNSPPSPADVIEEAFVAFTRSWQAPRGDELAVIERLSAQLAAAGMALVEGDARTAAHLADTREDPVVSS